VVPEARPVAIANGDRSGGVEKQTIHVVARHVRYHPRLDSTLILSVVDMHLATAVFTFLK